MRSVSAPATRRQPVTRVTNLTVGSFETAETYLYKLATSEDVASSYIHVDDIFSNNPVYTNIDELLRQAYASGVKLESARGYLESIGIEEPRSKASDVLLDMVVKKYNLSGRMTKPLAVAQRDALMEVIAQIEGSNNPNPNLYDYQKKYDKYVQTVSSIKARDQIIARQINTVHAQYLKAMQSSKLSASDIKIIEEKLELNVTSDIGVEDTLSVFDMLVPTRNVKHVVCYASHDVVYQKVYKDARLTDKDVVNIDAHKIPKGGSTSPCIVFVVNSGAPYEVVYKIGARKLYLNVKYKHKIDVLASIKEILPHVNYTVKVVKVESVVRMYPILDTQFTTKFYYLLHRATTNPEYYQFFLNESTSPYPKKTHLKLRYRPKWRLNVTPTLKEEAYAIMSVPQTPIGDNYIELSVTAWSMASTLRMFTSFIPAIVTHYSQDLASKSDLYPLYEAKIQLSQTQKKLSSTEVKKQLVDMWPDVFSEAYLKVQPKNMVMVTTSETTKERWDGEIVYIGDTHYERKVLPFPPAPARPDFWFTSYKPTSKYIGYADNLHDESPESKIIPQSGESQKAAGVANVLSTKGMTSKNTPGPRDYFVGTEVIDVIMDMPVRRLGTKFTPDSVLHAVAMCKYGLSGDSKNIQDRSDQIRETLASYNTELYAQELYDMTSSQIREAILDKKAFFDPAMYIAGIRKFLGTDVYVIEITTDANMKTHRFMVPRHSQYCTGTSPKSECIVLCMNYGIKSDKLIYPHCELIVQAPEEGQVIKDISESSIFQSETSSRLNSIMLECTTQVPYFDHSSAYKSVHMSSRMWLFLRATGLKVVSQYVDVYGKARGFTVIHQGQPVTILCSPCPPMDLIHSDSISPTSVSVFESICGGKCVGRSDTGVWCVTPENDMILYARISGEIPPELKIMGSDPMPVDKNYTGKGSSRQAAYDRRLSTVLRELMKWTFEVYCHELRKAGKSITPMTVNEFAVLYLTRPRREQRPSYSIENVKEKLPELVTTRDVLKYLSRVGVFQVVNEKIVLHNTKYIESMRYYLSTIVKDVIYADHITVDPSYISGYYVSLYDFKEFYGVELLAGTDNPISVVKPNATIVESLLPEHRTSKTPIIYATLGAIKPVMYLVQATRLGKIGNAVDVCMKWDKTGRNVGYIDNNVDVSPDKDVLIYRIVAGRLVEHQYIESDDPDEGFYEVVMFQSEVNPDYYDYSALLRL